MAPESEPGETAVRIGCGAIVGLVMGLSVVGGPAGTFLGSTVAMGVVVAVSIIACAALA